MRYKIFTTSNR